MILFIFLVTLAYFIGSICSAIVICKTCALPDPRTAGSKNPGATNVLRIAGKKYASLVMIADILKGIIPVLIAKTLGADLSTIGFTALAVVIGHIYPIFFDFKGGKGVATAMGTLLGLHLIVGILVVATWLLVAKFSRYSSLAAIVSISLAPFYSLLEIQHVDIFLPLFIMTLLILYKHANNITRLIDKTEPKIKLKENMLKEITGGEPKTSLEIDQSVINATEKAPQKPKTNPKKTPEIKAVNKKIENSTRKNKATLKKAATKTDTKKFEKDKD